MGKAQPTAAQKQLMQRNFVPNIIPQPNTQIVESGHASHISPVWTVNNHETSEWDRAKAFSLFTFPLATIAGIGMLLRVVVGWGVPVLSLLALLSLIAGFSVIWLAAWLVYILVSPTGLQMFHLYQAWRERHKSADFAEERWWFENEQNS